ncbi:MAG: hypothetical protein ACKO9R_07230 [Dolichospermum sp.]|jgi:hypothetical protein|uniref:Uncharacterized protein n=1 Tax=Sphaerospermopsis reniformis TaxID=531300 RepID=A0A479ZW66_9CYAN|nr:MULTISPECIES: hypothetical protein [Sphaerospermopsis]MBD2132291.1 hypothetical protein [Sphaerospermopsis sp. FACHB-1094]GCL36737.1 hypothetical protein SR1949_18430 [Sphaerospermopsis reniformis]
MSELVNKKIYLVTGVRIAIDSQGGILIAGILSDTPFTDEQDSETLSENPIANFAFTRQQATFLRERLNEFLREE